MNTDINTLTEGVLGAAFEVSNTLGAGFLEKVYERALLFELRNRGMNVIAQPIFSVEYKGECIGEFCPDILVENSLLVELKCVERFCPEHLAQCLNYLRASHKKLCLLLNFHKPTVEWKRLAP